MRCLATCFVCTSLAILASGPAAAQSTSGAQPPPPAPAADAQGVTRIPIVYLAREQADPSRASLLEPVVADYGLQGAEFGLQEINNSGRFLGKQYELVKIIVPTDADVGAAAKKALVSGKLLIVADLEANDLLTVADLTEAKNAVILDARSSDDSLRQGDCRGNVFHVLPNWAMRADALGQYLARKNWKRWFLLRGVAPEDEAFAAAVRRAATRFGAKIVAEKSYEYRGNADDPASGREQVQAQLPGATRTHDEYDVLFVADTTDAFGDYLLFNTWDPRPVVGTHGLVAEAWDPQFREYAARGVLYRFFKAASRQMTERDYGNSLAMAVIAEAVVRGGNADPAAIESYILSDSFSLAANKGEGVTFRRWDQQLRQPLLLFGPRMLVSMAPQSDARHPKFQTDTLGFDQPDSSAASLEAIVAVTRQFSGSLGLLVLALTAGRAEAGQLFISDERDNTVTVLDAQTLAVIKSIPVGRRPRGLVITPDYKEVLVCAGDDNRIDVIDTAALTVTRSMNTGPDPETLGLSPSGKTVYIANEDDSMVTMLERATGKVLGHIPVGLEPEGIAVNSDESIGVVVSESSSMAHFFDPKTQKVTANVLVDARPRVVVFTPDEKYVWVAAEVGGTVEVINSASKEVEKKISFAVPGVRKEFLQPEGIRFARDGSVAFVALGRANHVAVVNLKTFEVEQYIQVGRRVWQLGMSPDATKLYAVNGLTNDVSIIDVAAKKVEKSVTVGRLPWGIAVMP